MIESAIREALGLDVLDELWSKASLSEAAAMDLALEAQQATRRKRRKAA